MDRFRQKELARLAPGEFGISHFAMQVVAIMLGEGPQAHGALRADIVDFFVRAARTGDPRDLQRLLNEMRRARISAEAAVDLYIPAAVEELGDLWHNDVIDILDATIATSRLQNLLRELGRAWSADNSGLDVDVSVLIVVPEREQHLLGSMIATTQLRRMGVSVCLLMAPGAEELDDVLATQRFDLALLSIGNLTSVDAARRIVKTMRKAVGAGMPISAGGSIPVSCEELRTLTGADHAGRDVRLVLRQLGVLEMPQYGP